MDDKKNSEPLSKNQEPFFKSFVAGGIAGLVSRTATAPLDILKVRLQVEQSPLSTFRALQHIHGQGGLKAFYVGNGINMMKVCPESAIKFGAYQAIKSLMSTKEDENFMVRVVSGGIAGGIAQTIVYPFDTLKTRLQTVVPPPATVRSLASNIYKQNPRVFYRGLLPSLIGVVPYAGIDLALYEALKDLLPNEDKSNPWLHLGCGMVSGSVAATAVFPLQVIRTRLQAREVAEFGGMFDAFRKTVMKEGYKALYKGLTPTLMKVAPAAAITFCVVEQIKKLM